MNLPQAYMCSPSWTLLPPPSPYHPSNILSPATYQSSLTEFFCLNYFFFIPSLFLNCRQHLKKKMLPTTWVTVFTWPLSKYTLQVSLLLQRWFFSQSLFEVFLIFQNSKYGFCRPQSVHLSSNHINTFRSPFLSSPNSSLISTHKISTIFSIVDEYLNVCKT